MPFSTDPFARQRLTSERLTTRTPEAHAWALQQLKTFRSEGQLGRSGVVYINANDVAWTGKLTELKRTSGIGGVRALSADKYQFTGYNKFLELDGYPAVAPPRGTLNAIELNTGRRQPDLTASGVLFIGATIHDRKLRAIDHRPASPDRGLRRSLE
jgi:hypothetical protein